MKRVKLTEEERNSRRMERNKDLLKNYKRYDDSKGRGNPDEWKTKAEKIAALLNKGTKELSVLGLEKLPSSLVELKKAWKKAMLTAHPDKGGSEELAAQINSAYEILAKKF